MKILLFIFMLTGFGYAQTPATAVRRDSMPSVLPPDFMPNTGANNSFYRSKSDPKNVIRATLDNMPIKVPDSSMDYTMLRPPKTYLRPNHPPTPFMYPVPPILPKYWKNKQD